MHRLNKLGRFFTSIFLQFTLFALVFVVGFSSVFFNEQTIKNSLSESGIYDEFIVAAIEKVQTESTDENNPDGLPDVTMVENPQSDEGEDEFLPLEDNELKEVINKSITPATIQKHTETLISSLFNWLNKTTENIEFSIDMTDTKNLFIENLSNHAADKVAALPACTLQDANMDTNNVFDITCRPPGFTAAQAAEIAREELTKGEFLEDPIITEELLSGDESDEGENQSIEESLSFLPGVFSIISTATIPLLLLLIGVSIGYVMTRRPIKNGLKKLGWRFLTTGLVSLLITAIFKFSLPYFKTSGDEEKDRLLELVNEAVFIHLDKLATYLLIISVAISIVGVSILVLQIFRKRQNRKNRYK